MRRLLAVAGAGVVFAACGDSAPAPTPTPTTRAEVVASQAEGGFDARRIYEQEAPGVVTIASLFGSESGTGSGFVVGDTGEIVTNAHVVSTGEAGEPLRKANAVYVEFADGNRVEARVLGRDPKRTSRC